MNRLLLGVTVLFVVPSVAQAQAPNAETIQLAMNESLELDFPHFQELADVQVVRGGATVEGDYLFLCTARLVWKLSSAEFAALMQQGIDEEVALRGGDETIAQSLNFVMAGKLERIGEFETGGAVTDVRFRVRLEQAGPDWIVTESKVRESDRNPLKIIDDGSP
jgi:hypothetical protein